jgi:hypothetical protein
MSRTILYLRWSGTVFMATLACIALLNAYVDPYRLYRLAQEPPASIKPRASQKRFVSKAYGIAYLHPKTLILGNSRAEIGFDPQSSHWPTAAAPVFNAAIPGTGLGTGLSYLRHAIAHGEIRQVVVAVEFLDFLTSPSGTLTEDSWSAEPRALDGWKDRLGNAAPTLLSLDALYDTALTLISQRDPFAENTDLTGFNPLREYQVYARREGYGALFLQRDRENARAYSGKPKALFFRNTQTSGSWREVDRLLELSRRYGFSVTFVIYPYHAHILEMFHATGLWPSFEQWKGRLVEILEAERAFNPGACLELWDFSGYHRFARERVPPLGDKTTVVNWYWEAGHFKRELGEEILARIFGAGDPSFGTRLTRENLFANNYLIRQEREDFVRAQPGTIAAIDKMVSARD